LVEKGECMTVTYKKLGKRRRKGKRALRPETLVRDYLRERVRTVLSKEILLEDYEAHHLRHHGQRSRATSNWLTTLTHPCEAYGIFARITPPKMRRPIGLRLALTFAEGKDQQSRFELVMRQMGYKVERAEEQLSLPEYQIVARRDFLLSKTNTQRRYIEFKSMSPWLFQKVKTIASFQRGFLKKYWRQVVGLMALDKRKDYWIVCKDRSSGFIKVFEFRMGQRERREWGRMLARAARINKHFEHFLGKRAGLEAEPEAPRRTKLCDKKFCSGCEFRNVCDPWQRRKD